MAGPGGVNVPSVDQGRQALAALKGYRHQLYATALAWAKLPPGGRLLAEVTEDYALHVGGALKAVQVKSEAGPITLRSKGPVDLINAFWRLRGANPDLEVQAVYLTTAAIGREQGSALPNGAEGIAHWRSCAREDVALGPLKLLLASLPLEPELRTWLAGASDVEVRRELLARIRWECGAPSISELDQLLGDAILVVGEARGLYPSDAEKVKDALLVRLLAVASTPGQRELRHSDFLSVMEAAASAAMPLAALRQALAGSPPRSASSAIAVSLIPQVPSAVPRTAATGQLKAKLVQTGCVWLYGGTGLGKTSLALEAARLSNRLWSVASLRDCDTDDLRQRLIDARQATAEANFGGLILDDLPEEALHNAKLELAVLAEAVRRADGGLICTSYRSPAPSLTLGTLVPAPMEAPYFDDDEVAQMVKEAGGDPALWAKLVKLFAGDGHPQLVAARIAGLKARGWPAAERLAGFDPSAPLLDIEAERDSARSRLIRELPTDATALLYRLTACSGSFDRRLALAMGAAPPPLTLPGAQFDLLIGAWIETIGRDRFRASPLVEDAAEKNLSPVEIAAVDRAIVEDLTSRNPFPGDRLGLLFISALRTQHEMGLRFVAYGVLQANEEVRPYLARNLGPLVHLRTDSPIFPADPDLSALLRMTQLRLATFAKYAKLFAIAQRLITETEDVENPADYRNAGIATVLTDSQTPLTAAEWVSLLPHLDDARSYPGPPGSTQQLTLRRFAFIWRATHLAGVAQLADLFTVLDKMEAGLRDAYLNTLEEPLIGVRAMVQEPWVADSKQDDFDARATATVYAQLGAMARRWGQRRILIECTGCQAVLLSEYVEDHAGAIKLLDDAIQEWPEEPRLLRELSKILFRLGDYAGALARQRAVAPRLAPRDYAERLYLFREMAISAAHLGDVDAAIAALNTARSAAKELATYQAKAVGLLADRALMEFRAGRRPAALVTIRDALAEADALDPTERKVEFVLRMIGHLVLWMIYREDPQRAGEVPADPVYGYCSRDASEYDWPQPLVPIEGLWYQLEELETTMGIDVGISAAVEQRVTGRRIDFFEVQREFRAAKKRVLTGDIAVFVASLRQHGPMGAYLEAVGPSEEWLSVSRVQPETTWSTIPFDLTQPSQFKWCVHAATAFLSVARFEQGHDLTADLVKALAAVPEMEPLVQLLSDPTPNDGPADFARRLLGGFPILTGERQSNPTELFVASANAFIWLDGGRYLKEAGPGLFRAITDRWRWTLTNASFALRQPRQTAPAIAATCEEAPSLGQLARLLLAALSAVTVRIDSNIRGSLEAAASATRAES